MMILDTDVVSALRRSADSPLSRWLTRQPETPCLSVQTVTELQYGISLARRNNPRLAGNLAEWLETIIQTMTILALEVEAARLVGEMRAITHLRPLGGDLMIAATAIGAAVPLVTLNLRDFRLIALHFPALVVADPLGSR